MHRHLNGLKTALLLGATFLYGIAAIALAQSPVTWVAVGAALRSFDLGRTALEQAWQKVASANEYCAWPKLPHPGRKTRWAPCPSTSC